MWDLNPGSSSLEADALTTKPTRRSWSGDEGSPIRRCGRLTPDHEATGALHGPINRAARHDAQGNRPEAEIERKADTASELLILALMPD